MAEPERWTMYQEYLETRLWKRIRARVLKRDCKKCARCGGIAREVHHRSYEIDVLEGRADHLLVSLCRGCHEVIEIDETGRKRMPAEVEEFLAIPAAVEIPDVVIKGKKRPKLLPPSDAGRLSSAQLADYYKRGFLVTNQIAKVAQESVVARRNRYPRDPIESNLYPTDQIIWILKAILRINQPRIESFVGTCQNKLLTIRAIG